MDAVRRAASAGEAERRSWRPKRPASAAGASGNCGALDQGSGQGAPECSEWRTAPSSPRTPRRARALGSSSTASWLAHSGSDAWPPTRGDAAPAQAREAGGVGLGLALGFSTPPAPRWGSAGSPMPSEEATRRQVWSPSAGWPSPQGVRAGSETLTTVLMQTPTKPLHWLSPCGRAPAANAWPPLPWAAPPEPVDAAAREGAGVDIGLGLAAAARETPVLVDAAVRLYGLGAAEAFCAEAAAASAVGLAVMQLRRTEQVPDCRGLVTEHTQLPGEASMQRLWLAVSIASVRAPVTEWSPSFCEVFL